MPQEAQPSTPAAEWAFKGGDPQRTSFVNRTCPHHLFIPHWSFYHYDVAYTTPLIDRGGNVYVAPTSGEVYKLKRDGDLVWTYQLNGSSPANPAMADGTIFISDSIGKAYAIDAETGQLRWSRQLTPKNGSPGNYGVSLGGGLVFFHASPEGPQSGSSFFIACQASTGEEQWQVEIHSPVYNVMPAMADGDSALVYTDMDGGTHKLEVATGRELWSSPGFPFAETEGWNAKPGMVPHSHSAMALVGNGVVYTAGNPTRHTGRVRALRLDTGEEIWRTEFDSMMGNGAALADIDGVPTLVFGTGVTALHPIPEAKPPFIGKLYALEAATGRELWRFQAEPMLTIASPGTVVNPLCTRGNLPDSWSVPLIDGRGIVYVGWQGGILYAVNGRNGKLVSLFNTTEGIQSQPTAGPSGELVITSGMHVHSFWSSP